MEKNSEQGLCDLNSCFQPHKLLQKIFGDVVLLIHNWFQFSLDIAVITILLLLVDFAHTS